MTIQFQITQNTDGVRTLTFIDRVGGFHQITSDSPGFDFTVAHIMANDLDAAIESSVPLNTLVRRLSEVNADFGTDGTGVTYRGVGLSDRLSNVLIGYARQGSREVHALSKFIVRLFANPSAKSVQNLYGFLDSAGIAIDEDGYLLCHKGVAKSGTQFRSLARGTAQVNGVTHEGTIPQNIGDVVSMPRNQVQDDPDVACHTGLHVGSHSYASSWGPVLLTVRVDPADVVSVPSDHNNEKMRVSRYTVVAVNTSKQKFDDFAVHSDGWDGWDY